MRFVQAIFGILTFYPTLIPMILSSQPPAIHKASELAMLELDSHLNLTRRALRLFWCLGSFQSGWNLYSATEKSPEAWLSIMSNTLFGLFGLMESVTLPDLLHVRHLSIFGFEEAVRIDSESQALWLGGLVLSALASGVGIFRAFAYRAVPETGAGFGTGEHDEEDDKSEKKTPKKGGKRTGASKAVVADQRKKDREALAKENSRQVGRLIRTLLADSLDCLIPAWSTGLINIDVGTVCIAMFGSTLLTGYAVWERCGQQIDSRRS